MTFNYAAESKKNTHSVVEGEVAGLHGVENNALPSSVRQGYSSAFENIWHAHSKQILRVTERITKNREDAEDALQDSFLRAYVHQHSFDGRSSLSTWLTRIAINSALMILRKRATAPQFSIDDNSDSATRRQVVCVADARPTPEALYVRLEDEAKLEQSVRALRPSVRKALEFQVLEDHSIQETAEKMGLSVSATKSRIFQAKAALKRALHPKLIRRGRGAARLQLSPA
jgi:RNA polymerase sigma factor (sigma-70 family)